VKGEMNVSNICLVQRPASLSPLLMKELELNSYFFLRPVLAERGREKEVDH
jgi:hypothetical protein